MVQKSICLLAFAAMILWGCSTNKNQHKQPDMTQYDFNKAWEKVEALENQGLAQTVFKKVMEIYQEAIDAGQSQQVIKSLLYQGKYFNEVEEDGMIKTIGAFENSLANAGQPEKSILQSLLGELYDTYLMANLWQINDRTDIPQTTETDIRNWSARQLVDQSTKLYLTSVSYEGLASIPVDQFAEILTKSDHTEGFRNTLFDVLGHRAIDYFREKKVFLAQSPDRFILKDEALFSDASVFSKLDFQNPVGSREMEVLKLFRDLTWRHILAGNREEVLDLDINRLNYVKSNFISSQTDQLYESSLKKLLEENQEFAGAAEVSYYLAELYRSRHYAQYDPMQQGENLLKKAHLLCVEAIEKYPGTYGADLCAGLKSNLEDKSVQITTEQVNLPDETLICQIQYKNIPELFFRLVQLDQVQLGIINELRQKEVKSYISGLEKLSEFSQKLPGSDDFMQHTTEIAFDALDKGIYGLVASDHPSFNPDKGSIQLATFFVSELAYWHTTANDQNYIYVVNRQDGNPVANVGINLYEWDYRDRQRYRVKNLSLTTNEEGYAIFKIDDKKHFNYMVELVTKDETLFFENALYGGRYNYQPRVNQKILYFLDRSIYRPGQTVYFKGILIEENSNGLPRILPGQKEMVLNLYDVNQQEVGEVILDNNEFGSFSGSFTLPSSGLTGQMSIGSNRTRDRVFFSVEEYKRPKFQVELKEYEKAYKLGDRINLTGLAKSYAGVNISNAKVVYRVRRMNYFPYWSYFRRYNPFNIQPVEISNGTTITDENGSFTIPVELLADDMVPSEYKPYFRYEISVDVVDLTGETHSDSYVMHASWLTQNVSLEVPEKTHKDQNMPVLITAKNWNGKDIKLKARLEIFQLETPGKTYRERFWAMPDTWTYDKIEFESLLPHYSYKDLEDQSTWKEEKMITQVSIDTGVDQEPTFKLSPGTYKIRLIFSEPNGEEVKLEKFASVYDDQNLPAMTLFTFDAAGGEPGNTAKIGLQADPGRLPVLLEVYEKENRTLSEWKILNGKISLELPILEKHRGDFFVRSTFVYNNRFYTETKRIEVPWTNKKLTFEYTHFRSVLQPGEKEKWTIKVLGPGNEKVYAEMLASMYDASLDAIKGHNWYASIYPNNYLNSSVNYFGFGQGRTRSFIDRDWNYYYAPQMRKTYKTINLFGLDRIPGYSLYREDLGVVEAAAPRTVERMMSKRVANGEMEDSGGVPPPAAEQQMDNNSIMDDISGGGQAEEVTKDKLVPPQSIRANLNETVFFYPHLKTDEEGNVLIEFTMNEALTSWNFMGLSHTKDLKIGFTQNEVITQKELMIRPNPPRFVRQGDELIFTGSVSNLSGEKLPGTAVLQLFDASGTYDITSKFLAENEQRFDLVPGGNISREWMIKIPEGFNDLIRYKMWVRSGNFTDGEEGYLPVLSNRKLVTETLPMWIGGKETKEFHFGALDKFGDKKLVPHRFTIETTSHPVWYAIQALPYISDYQNSNSIGLANALYANLLAAHIVEQNPAIANVFKQWKESAKLGQNSLESNLEKNQELKNILLRETPWLLEALDETAQMANIALLFERNKVDQDKRQLLQLLQSLQRYDGGFSWFKGGNSSEFITLYVLEMIGKINELGISTSGESQIQTLSRNALVYADESFSKRYSKLLESAKDPNNLINEDHLSHLDIYYLYVRSLFREVPYNSKAKEASVFFINQAEKYWLNKGLYLQGMLALTLNSRGNSETAKKILRSLEERSIYSEELGRYWKHYHGYHWAELPIETQAMLIGAFSKIYDNKQLVQQMQVWLLKHKQTNRWKTAKASVAAIHALLLDNGSSLMETALVSISLGDHSIIPDEGKQSIESGTGYFKRSFTGNEIKKEFESIRLENPNEGIAWGAAYWQYFQDLDRIESFTDTPVKVSRELYKTKDGKNGEELFLLDSNTKLEKGDKVKVRLRIEVDRPMDFIYLGDQRGAGLENIEQISMYHWTGGLFYYMSPRDSGTDLFFENLPRGVYIIEYPLRAVHAGNYSGGIATLQSMYAPEFSSHSEGVRVVVE